MASVNRVIILGNLGQDPELRYTSNNTAVCTLSVATTDHRMDRDGNKQELTEWHRVIVWNKQAENCSKFLKKGRSVYVEGRLQTRSWEDKNGQKRYTTEIVAQTVQFIGGGNREASQEPPLPPEPYESQQQSGSSFDSGSSNSGFGGSDSSAPSLDDIPF